MKTTNSGSKRLLILLTVLLSSKLCAQSINVTASLDSARAEFLLNAKNIHSDLIKGDFSAEREWGYKATIAEKDKAYEVLAVEYSEANKKAGALAGTLFETKDRLGAETNKKRAARLENWAWRALAIITIYAKIKGL